MSKSELKIIADILAFLRICEKGAMNQFVLTLIDETSDFMSDNSQDSFAMTDDEDFARSKAKQFAKILREIADKTRSKSEIYRNNANKRYNH